MDNAIPDIATLNFDQEELPKDSLRQALEEVAILADRQAQSEEKVHHLMAELEKEQRILADLAEKQLPECLERLKLESVTTSGGLKVVLDKKIRANLPKDPEKQARAFRWLEEHGHDNLIKREFKILFGKEDLKWAKKFEGDLKKRKRPLDCSRKETIHHGTLASFITEQLEAGVNVPMDAFGAFHQKRAKITRA